MKALFAFVLLFSVSSHAQQWIVHCNPSWNRADFSSAAAHFGFDQIQFIANAETARYRRDVAGLTTERQPVLMWIRHKLSGAVILPERSVVEDGFTTYVHTSHDGNPLFAFRNDNNFWPKENVAEAEAEEDMAYIKSVPFRYRFGAKRGTVVFHVWRETEVLEWWAWPDFPHHAELKKSVIPIEFWIARKDRQPFTGWRFRYTLRAVPRTFLSCAG